MAINFSFPQKRVNGGCVSSKKGQGKDEATAHDQDKGLTRRIRTNTKREPTLRTNETAARRGEQNQLRTRTSEKGKRKHRKRGTAKAKGDAKDQTATNPKP